MENPSQENKTFHHLNTEDGLVTMKIAFSDGFVTHSWNFLIHENFSIQSIKRIVEDALLRANREEIDNEWRMK